MRFNDKKRTIVDVYTHEPRGVKKFTDVQEALGFVELLIERGIDENRIEIYEESEASCTYRDGNVIAKDFDHWLKLR